jgi:hypothetical protein
MIEEVGSLFGRIPFHKISSQKRVDIPSDVSSDEERRDVVKTMSYDAVSLSDNGSCRRKEFQMKSGGSTFLDIVSTSKDVNEKRCRVEETSTLFARKYKKVFEKDETSTSKESSFELSFDNDDKKKEKKPLIQMLN